MQDALKEEWKQIYFHGFWLKNSCCVFKEVTRSEDLKQDGKYNGQNLKKKYQDTYTLFQIAKHIINK